MGNFEIYENFHNVDLKAQIDFGPTVSWKCPSEKSMSSYN